MDLFMPPGYGTKKRKSPTPPDSFQKELQTKMKERKKLGLTAEVTPSASERETDDELGSDDDLMAHFNMTSKHDNKKKNTSWAPPNSRRSPTRDRNSPSSNKSKSPSDMFGRKTPNSISEDEDEDDFSEPSNLMMTMKKPMKPMDFTRRDGSKTMPSLRKSKTLASVNKDEPQKDKKWSPPSSMKHTEDEKENQPVRPKSPNVRGRRTPTNLLDCIEEESKPKPSPRIKKRDASPSFSRPVPQPRGRSPKDRIFEEEESEDEEIVRFASGSLHQTPQRDFFKKSNRSDTDRKMASGDRSILSDGKRTPSDGRRTPSDGRRTPSDGRRTPSDGRKTPSDGRKTPSDGRKTPSDGRTPLPGRRTPSDGRKTPSDGRKTPSDGRKTPSDGRKTPSEGRKTPEPKKSMFGRKGSSDGIFGRKTPTEENKKRISFGTDQTSNEDSSPMVQKKSILDMFSAGSKDMRKPKKADDKSRKSLLAESDSDSDIGMGAPRRSPIPLMSQQPPGNESRRSPVGQRRKGDSLAHGSLDHDVVDDVDGFRMSPSAHYREHERASPTYRRPSLKNRSDSPADSAERGAENSNTRRPSLRRKDALDDDRDEDLPEYNRHQKDIGRGRQMTRQADLPERDSSTCRDIDVDPTMVKQKEQIKERKLAKTYTANGRMLEDAIMSVGDAQDNRMKYIEPDKTDDNNKAEKLIAKKTPKHCPKPRYAKPVINTMPSPSSSSLSFNSTTDIRMAVYQEWYQEQLEKTKKELKEKKQREKELEKKQIEGKKEKLFEAKASYQAWLEKKKEALEIEKRKKKQNEEEEARKKRHEEEEKKKEAELTFRSWKGTKDAFLRRELLKKKKEEERKQEEERAKQREKNKYSKTVFEKWKGKKDELIKTEKLNEKKTKKQKEEEERRAQEERERIALESYLKWIEKKEQQPFDGKKHKKRHEENRQLPWFPSSPTVTLGR